MPDGASPPGVADFMPAAMMAARGNSPHADVATALAAVLAALAEPVF